jgi:glycosyltransferase involved in cell wall biosynthesis
VRIAFIVQRYGTEILGGSEYHCRLVAERLADQHQVEVLTTCARDYITWANEYPEGADRVRGVTVRRFATTETRDLVRFNAFSEEIFLTRHGRQDELEWLKRQGPWSPGLIDYLERQHHQYDILIFFTYLYAPTVLGITVAPWKSLLVPTAHDEPAIRLGIYRDVFAAAAGIVWNTDSERAFVTSMMPTRALVEDVVGCGVDLPEGEAIGDRRDREEVAPTSREAVASHIEGPANAFRRRHRIYGPFALYGGRIDPGKGCEEMFEYFKNFLDDGGDVNLVLMGTKLMPLPDDPRVRFAGMLPDEERLNALEAASVVIVPSPHESLSLLALEAFAVGTPVLANARSEVLVDHCRQSNAGLYYADRWEFSEALKLILSNPSLAALMGQNGKAYVNQHYRWSTILTKYERMFTRLRLHSREPDRERPRGGSEERDEPRPRQTTPDRPRGNGRSNDRRGGRRPPDRSRGRHRPQGRR